jgi:hypothetical protein
LKKLSSLTNLEALDIQGSSATDRSLEYLKGLPKLREIYFGGSQLTEPGLCAIGYTVVPHSGIAKK